MSRGSSPILNPSESFQETILKTQGTAGFRNFQLSSIPLTKEMEP